MSYRPIHQVLGNRPFPTVAPNNSIRECAFIMKEWKSSAVLVVDGVTAPDALRNATLFRMGLGDTEQALANAELFSTNYGRTRQRETAQVHFSIGAIYERTEQRDHTEKVARDKAAIGAQRLDNCNRCVTLAQKGGQCCLNANAC